MPFAVSLAEQIGSSPESGVDSRLQQAYQSVTDQGHGLSSVPEWTHDWGSRWNRIMAAASWVPGGDVQPSEVILGKTYLAGDRSLKTGTLDLGNLADDQISRYQGYNRQADTNNTNWPGDTGSWTQLVATGGSPASVTANGSTLTLASTRVMRDNRTGLIWTDSTTGVTHNAFTYVPAESNLENPTTHSCNFASIGTANEWCNVTGYTGHDNVGWSGWNNPTALAAPDTAKTGVSANEFCLNLVADDGSGVQSDWRLPTQRELMLAYLNGAPTKLPPTASYFWAATQYSGGMYNARIANLSGGTTTNANKWATAGMYVRCVREG